MNAVYCWEQSAHKLAWPVVIGGILSSTLLTLLVLPGLYRMACRPDSMRVAPAQTLQESHS